MACMENLEINRIVGDKSWELTFGVKPTAEDSRQLRTIIHLKYVKQLLRKSSDPSLQHRTKHLDHLAEYVSASTFPGEFTCGEFIPGRPCFVDNGGTHCAVGYLMKQDQAGKVVASINEKFRYDFLMDMDLTQIPEACQWVAESGFSILELAMIQPTYDFRRTIPTPILPTLPPQVVHTCYQCDGCSTNPIRGNRYWCVACKDFDFCETCERTLTHDSTHLFLKIKSPDTKVKETLAKFLKEAGHLNVKSTDPE